MQSKIRDYLAKPSKSSADLLAQPLRGKFFNRKIWDYWTIATSNDQQDRGVMEKSETTTPTTTETKAEYLGIISSSFHAIGYFIPLLFFIIGEMFQMIIGG